MHRSSIRQISYWSIICKTLLFLIRIRELDIRRKSTIGCFVTWYTAIHILILTLVVLLWSSLSLIIYISFWVCRMISTWCRRISFIIIIIMNNVKWLLQNFILIWNFVKWICSILIVSCMFLRLLHIVKLTLSSIIELSSWIHTLILLLPLIHTLKIWRLKNVAIFVYLILIIRVWINPWFLWIYSIIWDNMDAYIIQQY